MKSKNLFIKLFLTAMLLVSARASAQVTIGSGVSPAPYALLELDTGNTPGGLRLPQLSGAEAAALRTSVKSAGKRAEGLMYHDLDTNCIKFWNGTGEWQQLCGDYSVVRHLTGLMDESVHRIERMVERLNNIETRMVDVRRYIGRNSYPPFTGSVPSVPRPALNVAGGFTGVNLYVISTGYFYNLIGTGTLLGSAPQSNGTRYYLFVSGDSCVPGDGVFGPLSWHRQDARTVGSLWINNASHPLYFDHTGIYFVAASGGTVSGTFHFSQALILIDPNY